MQRPVQHTFSTPLPVRSPLSDQSRAYDLKLPLQRAIQARPPSVRAHHHQLRVWCSHQCNRSSQASAPASAVAAGCPSPQPLAHSSLQRPSQYLARPGLKTPRRSDRHAHACACRPSFSRFPTGRGPMPSMCPCTEGRRVGTTRSIRNHQVQRASESFTRRPQRSRQRVMSHLPAGQIPKRASAVGRALACSGVARTAATAATPCADHAPRRGRVQRCRHSSQRTTGRERAMCAWHATTPRMPSERPWSPEMRMRLEESTVRATQGDGVLPRGSPQRHVAQSHTSMSCCPEPHLNVMLPRATPLSPPPPQVTHHLPAPFLHDLMRCLPCASCRWRRAEWLAAKR